MYINTENYQINKVTIEGMSVFLSESDCMPRYRISFGWRGHKGFGNIYITHDPDPQVNGFYIDSELMSRDFVKAVLCKMVDQADICQ